MKKCFFQTKPIIEGLTSTHSRARFVRSRNSELSIQLSFGGLPTLNQTRTSTKCFYKLTCLLLLQRMYLNFDWHWYECGWFIVNWVFLLIWIIHVWFLSYVNFCSNLTTQTFVLKPYTVCLDCHIFIIPPFFGISFNYALLMVILLTFYRLVSSTCAVNNEEAAAKTAAVNFDSEAPTM